jgi:hypothetical protein
VCLLGVHERKNETPPSFLASNLPPTLTKCKFEARKLGAVSFFLSWTPEKAPGCPGKNSNFIFYPTPLLQGVLSQKGEYYDLK